MIDDCRHAAQAPALRFEKIDPPASSEQGNKKTKSIEYGSRPACHALKMSYPFCSLCPQEQSGRAKSCEIVALRAGGGRGLGSEVAPVKCGWENSENSGKNKEEKNVRTLK